MLPTPLENNAFVALVPKANVCAKFVFRFQQGSFAYSVFLFSDIVQMVKIPAFVFFLLKTRPISNNAFCN